MKQLEIKRAETLSEILNTFQPEKLNEENMSAFYYDKTMPIRMGDDYSSPMDALFEDCSMVSGANAHLLSGHRGCGKSAELLNLKHRLEKVGHPVHIVECSMEMNLSKAECWDVLLLIVEGLCHIAYHNGIELPESLLTDVFDYIEKDVTTETIKYTEASTQLGAVFELIAFIKANLKVGTQTRTNIKEKMERRASDWLRYVNEISDIITNKMNGKQPVLIFEDLDKIQPYERASDVFSYEVLSKLPFPVIYTFPIPLIYDAKAAYPRSLYRLRVLPMIKVANDDKTENKDGIEILRKIVKLRADEKLFEKDALTELIKQTGGVLRHLFECIITASRRARWREANRIEIEDSRRALAELSGDLRKQISMSDNDMLQNIYNNPKHKKQIEDREPLLKQMSALVVLEYQNGEPWHDLHPLIARFLRDQGVVNVENQ